MLKMHESPIKVKTPDGIGFLQDLFVTDLGHIQIRVRFKNGKNSDFDTFIKYTVSDINKILSESGIEILRKELNSSHNE